MPSNSESFLRGRHNLARSGGYKDNAGIVDALPTISPSSIPGRVIFPSRSIQEVSLSKLFHQTRGEEGLLINGKTWSSYQDVRVFANPAPSVAEFVEGPVAESSELGRDTVIWIEPRQKEDPQEDYFARSDKESSLLVSSSDNVTPSQSIETIKTVKIKRRLKRGTRVGLSIAIDAGTLTACEPQALPHSSHPGVSINQEVGQSHGNTRNTRPSTVIFGSRTPFFQTNGCHVVFAFLKVYLTG